jgi:hypothetical protein
MELEAALFFKSIHSLAPFRMCELIPVILAHPAWFIHIPRFFTMGELNLVINPPQIVNIIYDLASRKFCPFASLPFPPYIGK